MSKKQQLHELKDVYYQTNQALDTLLEKNKIKNLNETSENKKLDNIKLEKLRKKMADDHKNKITKLIEVLGKEAAITQARRELFKVGFKIGTKARSKLGVGDSFSDFSKAVKILYKILGIEIELNLLGNNQVIMYVNRCSLSDFYSDITCQTLSAADEGMIHGLNPKYNMSFKEKITCGSPRCMAEISINKNRVTK
jgi:hypothetical protein